MENNSISILPAINEPIHDYAPGSKERISLKSKLSDMENDFYEIPIIIGGKEIQTGNIKKCRKPHDHQHILAEYHQAGTKEVFQAIDGLEVLRGWSGAMECLGDVCPCRGLVVLEVEVRKHVQGGRNDK